MLKHIVMWRYKDGAEGKSSKEHAQWMKQNLEALVGVVPEIQSLEYGIDENVHPSFISRRTHCGCCRCRSIEVLCKPPRTPQDCGLCKQSHRERS